MPKKICCILFLIISLGGVAADAIDIMLPEVYEDNIDVSGWLMSEKFDGVRGYWDGEKLLSKNGIPFNPHVDFIKNLPDFPIEGEIWGGHNTFEKTSGIVRKQKTHNGWLDLKFAVFDVPGAAGGIEERLNIARQWFRENPSHYAFVITQKKVRDIGHLKEELLRVEEMGGEGLIVRKPDTLYTKGRSPEILKVKSYYDMEAVVIDHIDGEGRNLGILGSLLVELPDKTRFKIGTGFSDEERKYPPPVGSTITFKYYGFYKSGVPRFPSFLRRIIPVSFTSKP
ncbi:DNA ligase [bacterium BMS3Abin09]|nr:DNA ligase [bacterium BMS3Abin09]GBE41409.1 DNA ligase [bacterium BMS3Bbin09]